MYSTLDIGEHKGYIRSWSYQMVFLWFGQETNTFTVARNRKYKKTDSKNFVQSSLKCHPLWVALYLYMLDIASQTAGPNWLTFFDETRGYLGPGGNIEEIEIYKYCWVRCDLYCYKCSISGNVQSWKL